MTSHAQELFYCSQASRSRGEACFGSAVNADIWLLIECPEAWGRSAVAESSMPQAVKDHLKGLTQRSKRIRTQLIKHEPHSGFPHKVFIAYTYESGPKIFQIEIDSYNDLLQLDPILLIEEKLPFAATLVEHPLFLVCTHGRHDKCCAKFGFATYKYMDTIAPGEVWQTSHVGGDRYASNVISFPTGVYYGHVDDEAADAIILAERFSQIHLPNYRGRTCYGKNGQVGEYFVRRETGITDIESLRRIKVTFNEEKTRFTAHFVTADGSRKFDATFEPRRSAAKSLMTCHASEEKHAVEFHLIDFQES